MKYRENINGHDIIVVGASAGGVEALSELVSRFPADLPAAVFIVLHIPAYGQSALPSILSRRGPLPAAHPVDGDEIQPGQIYVAPPDRHLILRDGQVRLTRGPAENRHRPAIDTLFRSAARSYQRRVLGVVLSGMLDDGTAGLQAIKRCGGLGLVQDPDEALFAAMPRNALENVAVDYVQPLAQLAETLVRLTHEPVPEGDDAVPPDMELEIEIAELDQGALESPRDGTPSPYACPDCHGVLWEVQEGELLRFRCRVGHAYSSGSLLATQSDRLDDALWIALRALEESAALAERLQERALARGHALTASRFGVQAGDAHQRAEIIRQTLQRGQLIAASDPAAEGEKPS